MYNHGSVWVYEPPAVGHPFPYEPSDLGDPPDRQHVRISDHIDHHRFIPSTQYTYHPYASFHHWPPPPPSYLNAYPHSFEHSSQMARAVDAVPAARRHVSDTHPDGQQRGPPSPALPPMTRSPSLSASSIDRSATSSIPPITTSPGPHQSRSPRSGQARRGSYSDEVQYTYPPPTRDAHSGPSYAYHPSVHPSHRYPHYHPSTFQFNGSAASPPPPPPSQAPPVTNQPSTSHPRNVFIPPPPLPGQPSEIIHTDDAATKLSDRIRRRCFNCCTTETSTWRRSSLNPGKVLCNKCGLFERTHSRPRPEQFPHKRGPVTSSQRVKTTPTAPFPSMPPQLPSPPAVSSVAPHHYDHPSLAPLRSRAESQKSPRMDNLPAIKSLLQSPQTSKQSMPSPPQRASIIGGVEGSASPKPKSKLSVRNSRSPTRRAS